MVARKLCFSVNGLLLGLTILATPLPAAIVQTGDVEPVVSLWNSTTDGIIGYPGVGNVQVDAGSILASQAGILGFIASGTATVTGAGSQWTNSQELYIGSSWGSTLTIEAGGQVSNTFGYLGSGRGSTGIANVVGIDSKWTNSDHLYVGYSGDGVLSIESGGQVSTSVGYLGFWSGSSGTAMITGVGSKWTSKGQVGVGILGKGILTIEAGGQVNSYNGVLGNGLNSTGTVNVTGDDSQWINGTSLSIVMGTLTISAGGQVSSDTGFLGYQAGLTGAAIVTGVGSQWASNSGLIVGNGGRGALTIDDGGLVSVGGVLTIDHNLDNDSFINLATGGMLALRGEADDSLTQFLELVQGSDDIRFWNATLGSWAPLTTATYGTDYTLEYLTEGDLTGYTLLTVGTVIPEPATWLLTLGVAMVGSLVRRK